MKSGDRVTTPYGPATVRGFDTHSDVKLGKAHREAWIIVEMDDDPEDKRRRWLHPADVKPRKERT